MNTTLEAAIDGMDRFNQLIQVEIETAPPAVALVLAQIKFQVNQWFYQRRRHDARHPLPQSEEL